MGLHEVCVRTGVRYVITKFSGMDSLPNFLTHGAPLRARGSSAINLNKIQRSNERVSQDKECLERRNDSVKNKRSANSLHSSREFWAVST